MTLKHPQVAEPRRSELAVPPLFGLEATTIPCHELATGEMPADVAYQIIHDGPED